MASSLVEIRLQILKNIFEDYPHAVPKLYISNCINPFILTNSIFRICRLVRLEAFDALVRGACIHISRCSPLSNILYVLGPHYTALVEEVRVGANCFISRLDALDTLAAIRDDSPKAKVVIDPQSDCMLTVEVARELFPQFKITGRHLKWVELERFGSLGLPNIHKNCRASHLLGRVGANDMKANMLTRTNFQMINSNRQQWEHSVFRNPHWLVS
jgi:hypothetical protein